VLALEFTPDLLKTQCPLLFVHTLEAPGRAILSIDLNKQHDNLYHLCLRKEEKEVKRDLSFGYFTFYQNIF